MQHSIYHSILRISALSLACILMFESGLITPLTKELSDNTRVHLASVIGMQATVAPTELNSLTAELTEQKKQLDEREKALAKREIKVDLDQSGESSDVSTFILSAALFILLVLIVLNYALDYIRLKRNEVQQAT